MVFSNRQVSEAFSDLRFRYLPLVSIEVFFVCFANRTDVVVSLIAYHSNLERRQLLILGHLETATGT